MMKYIEKNYFDYSTMFYNDYQTFIHLTHLLLIIIDDDAPAKMLLVILDILVDL